MHANHCIINLTNVKKQNVSSFLIVSYKLQYKIILYTDPWPMQLFL